VSATMSATSASSTPMTAARAGFTTTAANATVSRGAG
jgi:hypothetical protein